MTQAMYRTATAKNTRKVTIPRKKSRHWEDADCKELWLWAHTIPELKHCLFHIPNGGKRDSREARRLKEMGVRPGVHDYFLPLARGGFRGLWMEYKAAPPNDAAVTTGQLAWETSMRVNGYAAYICRGVKEAKKLFLWYLSLPRPDPSERAICPPKEEIFGNG